MNVDSWAEGWAEHPAEAYDADLTESGSMGSLLRLLGWRWDGEVEVWFAPDGGTAEVIVEDGHELLFARTDCDGLEGLGWYRKHEVRLALLHSCNRLAANTELMAMGYGRPKVATVLPPPSAPSLVADAILSMWREPGEPSRVVWWRGLWWKHFGTHWAEVSDSDILHWLDNITRYAKFKDAGDEDGKETKLKDWNPTERKLRELVLAIRRSAGVHIEDGKEPPFNRVGGAEQSGLVPFRNGQVDLAADVVHPHSPAHFNLWSLPYDYDPDAGAEPYWWLRMLGDQWSNDPASILLLQEWFGYLLSGRTDLQRGLLIVGETRSGKGIIIRTAERLVGAANSAARNGSDLAERYALCDVPGKTLLTVADAHFLGKTSSTAERMKMMIGNDALSVECKYKKAYTSRLQARVMVMTNELPSLRDNSAAIVGRFELLEAKVSFLNREDIDLEAKIVQEMPQIVNWALQGLDWLFKPDEHGHVGFTQPESTKKLRREMQEQSAPVLSFLREQCVLSSDDEVKVRSSDLLTEYNSWARLNGHNDINGRMFGRRLLAALRLDTGEDWIERRKSDGEYWYHGIRVRVPRSGFADEEVP